MKIYFDESGQTGCVLLKKDMLNFANQPVFALGAVIAKDDNDERLLLEKYKKFKEKFKIVGEIVAKCISNDTVLENMPIEEYKKYSDLFDEDLYNIKREQFYLK